MVRPHRSDMSSRSCARSTIRVCGSSRRTASCMARTTRSRPRSRAPSTRARSTVARWVTSNPGSWSHEAERSARSRRVRPPICLASPPHGGRFPSRSLRSSSSSPHRRLARISRTSTTRTERSPPGPRSCCAPWIPRPCAVSPTRARSCRRRRRTSFPKSRRAWCADARSLTRVSGTRSAGDRRPR